MKMLKIFLAVLFLDSFILADSLQESMLINIAGANICMLYAEKVGGDAELFSEMNSAILSAANKMGYLDDLESFMLRVSKIKNIFRDELISVHGNELNVYNNWCVPLYNGFQRGVQRARE